MLRATTPPTALIIQKQTTWIEEMEAIADAASVSQLVTYSCSIPYLRSLYTKSTSDDSAYRNKGKNVRLLVNVVESLAGQDFSKSDHILPILTGISGLACEILYLLRPKRILGYNWRSLTTQGKINSAFEALDKKKPLLHLYIAQANNEALAAIRQTMDEQDYTRESTTDMGSRAMISSSNNYVYGHSEVGSGYPSGVQPDVDNHSNTVGFGATSYTGNYEQRNLSEATMIELQQMYRDLEMAKLAASKPPPQPVPTGVATDDRALPLQARSSLSASQTPSSHTTTRERNHTDAEGQTAKGRPHVVLPGGTESDSAYHSSEGQGESESQHAQGVRLDKNGKTATGTDNKRRKARNNE